ncbi:MAG: 4Fe-4S dicluster domain-containing protein [Deltaproteobacteria bacterium]|nr:4Fe-4S dicluster domain-containing protein [Deltaproteobacteria bacterium]
MTSYRFISETALSQLLNDLIAQQIRVVAPVRVGVKGYERVKLSPIYATSITNTTNQSIATVANVDFTSPLTNSSIKPYFLPPTEVLLKWQQNQGDIELKQADTKAAPTVIVGAHPCDVAAIDKLDKVMSWGLRDELWFKRREATTIISFTCTEVDDACFCTAVGLEPASRRGADLLFTKVDDGFQVEVLTKKGEALINAHSAKFAASDEDKTKAATALQNTIKERVIGNLQADINGMQQWLQSHFDDDIWQQIALRCHGCGVCAFICPSCHCFDIVDEPQSNLQGERRRNWDTCQTALFTLHGSGHNPRSNQNARYRQRVTHKFSIYPQRFDEILCTGCGRCVRACPGGIDLREVLNNINKSINATV